MPGWQERLMREVKENKAVGQDYISSQFLKCCESELSSLLTNLFMSYLREHRWSSIWKGIGNTSPKELKLSKLNDSRLILLLFMMDKLLEQVVARVICHYLSEHRFLLGRQFGFWPGCSTADHLTLLLPRLAGCLGLGSGYSCGGPRHCWDL